MEALPFEVAALLGMGSDTDQAGEGFIADFPQLGDVGEEGGGQDRANPFEFLEAGGLARQLRGVADVRGDGGFDLFLEAFKVGELTLELLVQVAFGEFETIAGLDDVVAEHAAEIAHLAELARIRIRLDLERQRDFFSKTTDQFRINGVGFGK